MTIERAIRPDEKTLKIAELTKAIEYRDTIIKSFRSISSAIQAQYRKDMNPWEKRAWLLAFLIVHIAILGSI